MELEMNADSRASSEYLSDNRCSEHIIAITFSCCTSIMHNQALLVRRTRCDGSLTENLHKSVLIGLKLVQSITECALINYLSLLVQALPLSDIHKRRDLKHNISENCAGKKGEPCLERADSRFDASMVTVYHRDPLILENKLSQETVSGLLLHESRDFFEQPEISKPVNKMAGPLSRKGSITCLGSSSRGAVDSRPNLYCASRVRNSWAAYRASAWSCALLSWICGTDDRIAPKILKAGLRYGTGAKDKQS
jgi:hypothetical protein